MSKCVKKNIRKSTQPSSSKGMCGSREGGGGGSKTQISLNLLYKITINMPQQHPPPPKKTPKQNKNTQITVWIR